MGDRVIGSSNDREGSGDPIAVAPNRKMTRSPDDFNSGYFFGGFTFLVPKLVSMLAPMLASISFAGWA